MLNLATERDIPITLLRRFMAVTIAARDATCHNVALSVQIGDPRISAIAFVPSACATSTCKMLPELILHADAVKNSANTALLVYA